MEVVHSRLFHLLRSLVKAKHRSAAEASREVVTEESHDGTVLLPIIDAQVDMMTIVVLLEGMMMTGTNIAHLGTMRIENHAAPVVALEVGSPAASMISIAPVEERYLERDPGLATGAAASPVEAALVHAIVAAVTRQPLVMPVPVGDHGLAALQISTVMCLAQVEGLQFPLEETVTVNETEIEKGTGAGIRIAGIEIVTEIEIEIEIGIGRGIGTRTQEKQGTGMRRMRSIGMCHRQAAVKI
jgi:hypothetical protein